MKQPPTDLAVRLRLSAQRALCGAIPPRLRAVSVDLSDKTIRVRSIFDGTPTDAESEALSIVSSEIIADFADPLFTISEEILAISHPEEMQHLRWLIYLRNENDFRWIYAA